MIKAFLFIAVIAAQSPVCNTTETDIELMLSNTSNSPRTKMPLRGPQAEMLISLINSYPPPSRMTGNYLVMYGAREGENVEIFVGNGPGCINYGVDLEPRVFMTIMTRFLTILRGGQRGP